MDALIRGDHWLIAAPAADGLRIGADRVVGQLQAGHGIAGGEQLETAVVPVVRGIGIAQQGVDLLGDCPLAARRLGADGAVHLFPPDDSARQAVGDGKLPVQAVGAGAQLQPGEGQAITAAQGLLPVALAGPAVLGGEHQHQGGAVAENQEVSSSQEHSQVRAPAIHVRQDRAQAGWEADPAAPTEHAGVGAQGIAEESRGAGGIKPLAVSGLRFSLALGEIVLLATAAVGGGEQRPAVGGDLQGGLQGGQGRMLGPRGTGRSSLRLGCGGHGGSAGLLALALGRGVPRRGRMRVRLNRLFSSPGTVAISEELGLGTNACERSPHRNFYTNKRIRTENDANITSPPVKHQQQACPFIGC